MSDKMEKDQPALIYRQLVQVMSEIGCVEKDQKAHASVGGYAFRGIDAVMAALQPALVKCGVVVVPEVLDSTLGEFKTTKGSVMQHAVLRVRYTFFAADGSSVSATVMGEGADPGDKSINKAMAGAMKYAITQALSVPTSEPKDAEADPVVGAEGRMEGTSRRGGRPVLRTVSQLRGAAAAIEVLPLQDVLDRIDSADSIMALQLILNQQARVGPQRTQEDADTIIQAASERKTELMQVRQEKGDEANLYV